VPSLAAKSFDFRDRHPLDPNFDQGILYLINFKRLYDRFDLLHLDLIPYYAVRRGLNHAKTQCFFEEFLWRHAEFAGDQD
jgi:hypothetical protein